MSRSLFMVIMLCVVSLAGCETVEPPATDGTPPSVKMDIHAPRTLGWPEETIVPVLNPIRRAIGRTDPITLVASAEDAESGISNVEIVAVVVRQCMVSRTFQGRPGVPDGPPAGRILIDESERVLGAAPAGGGALPKTRLVNATTTLGDLDPPECPPVKFAVNDDPPAYVDIAEQSTTYCGARVFARAVNGTGGAKSTAKALLLIGPPQSGAIPCMSVPF